MASSMFTVLLLLLSQPLASYHTNRHPLAASGSSACPCLTPAQAAQSTFANTPVGNKAKNISANASNSGYGVGCASHDASPPYVFPICDVVGDRPKWCDFEWCFVDDSCGLSYSTSEIRGGVFYSYATCGYLDAFDNSHLAKSLEGVKMSVFEMTNSGGWKGSYCTQGQGCSGVVANFLQGILDRSGVIPNVTQTFYGGSLSKYPNAYPAEVLNMLHHYEPHSNSPFDACVYATGMGYVDLCIGAFQMSSHRALISPMVHMYSEDVVLITTSQVEGEGWWKEMFVAFRPFQWEVWFIIFCFLIGSSWIMATMEYFDGNLKETSLIDALRTFSFVGLQSFVDSSSEFTPLSVGGRFISFGVGLFLLLMVSSYTANLASDLISQEAAVASVGSWQTVLSDGTKVCMMGAMYDFAINELKLPKSQAVVFNDRDGVILNVGTSTCLAGITAYEDFQTAKANNRKLCNLVRVGAEPLWVTSYAAPVSPRFARSLSYLNLVVKGEGLWYSLQDSDRPPSDHCDRKAQADATASAQAGMTLKDARGPVFVAGLICLVGVLCDLCLKHPRIKRLQRSRESTQGYTESREASFSGIIVTDKGDAAENGEASGDKRKTWDSEEVSQLVEASVDMALKKFSEAQKQPSQPKADSQGSPWNIRSPRSPWGRSSPKSPKSPRQTWPLEV